MTAAGLDAAVVTAAVDTGAAAVLVARLAPVLVHLPVPGPRPGLEAAELEPE